MACVLDGRGVRHLTPFLADVLPSQHPGTARDVPLESLGEQCAAWVRAGLFRGCLPVSLSARRRLHAHGVSAAAVRAAVVLGLRLRVEPRLHGGPLVRRVAASASCRPTWNVPRLPPFGALSALSPSLPTPASLLHARPRARTHTDTHNPSSSFQNHRNKVTGEAPGIHEQQQEAFSGLSTTHPRAQRKVHPAFGTDCHSLGNSSWAGFKQQRQRFLRFNFLHCTFCKDREEATGEEIVRRDGRRQWFSVKRRVDWENYILGFQSNAPI